MKSPLRIVVSGLIAQHPTLGGMTWHYLNYVIGLARMGHDVYYLEDSGQWPYLDGGATGNEWIAYDCSPNLNYLEGVLSRFGLSGRWAYRFPITSQWYGLSDSRRRELIRTADLLINVSGALVNPTEYRAVKKLVYVDTDPIFTQVKLARGQKPDWRLRAFHWGFQKLPARFQGVEETSWLSQRLAPFRDKAGTDEYLERLDFYSFKERVHAHDVHFSFGTQLEGANSEDGLHWNATRQPVVLSEWRTSCLPRNVFTTVMNWTSYKPIVQNGIAYGQKDIEFQRFLSLPNKLPATSFELALSRKEHTKWQTTPAATTSAIQELLAAHPSWSARDLLQHHSWRVVAAEDNCRDIDSYRAYIASSKAEWTIAKNGYVIGQPGWFSDRSACYLASGRPVIVQDTGFGNTLPADRGIVAFRDMDEAINAVRDVEASYGRHAAAASEIAEHYFDATKVLSKLIDTTYGGKQLLHSVATPEISSAVAAET